MRQALRRHGIGWWAALGHRISGLALAIFLPAHFLALGLALEGAAPLDGFLRFAELPLVKAAELGLVMLLSIHLVFGLRVLAIELLPWPTRDGLRLRLVYAGLAAMLVVGIAVRGGNRLMLIERSRTDILILGSGGAGLFAALHAAKANPDLDITVAVKGLLGKSGCTRMVQGGYNVALAAEDSIERHFMDTIVGGKWLPRQDLAWRLCTGAVERIRELENEIGCFFDRNPDGTLHQKAFAGQSFDRTVHKGDLTGIEIINRLMEQVRARAVRKLEDHRAIELISAADGAGIAGVLLIDIRRGTYHLVQAKAVLLATGAGPSMYLYHTPSGEKTCDGLAMALRLGMTLRDMEMVQFHPTGLLGGPDTRMTGTVLEEGLRGVGGHILNGERERFLARYDPAGERATRDVVSRGIYAEMRAGRTTPMGGVYIAMGSSRCRQGRENVSGHGQALCRLRFRPRRRAGRGGAHRPLHDGRRRVRHRWVDFRAWPVRRGRGLRRRARGQPAGRQRGRQLDRVRRHRGRQHGRFRGP